MTIHQLRTVQTFPKSASELWGFISNPENLSRITPPDMEFETMSGESEKAYAGQVITYKVSPLWGIRMDWVTEITHLKEGNYFVDEQRFGPYSFWHHQHFLRDIPGGCEMQDVVHYRLPMGFLGKLVHPILVRPRLKKIFAYRQQVLSGMFGEYKGKAQ